MQLGPADETNASLQLVAREIAAELNEARLALEAYAERPEERGLLDRFAGHLHLGAARCASPRSTAARCSRRKWSTSRTTSPHTQATAASIPTGSTR